MFALGGRQAQALARLSTHSYMYVMLANLPARRQRVWKRASPHIRYKRGSPLWTTGDMPLRGSILHAVMGSILKPIDMFYVIVEAEALGLTIAPGNGGAIVRKGEMVKAAAREQLPVVHPENPEIEGVTIAEISGPPTHPDATLKNAVVVSTGALDWARPETWTGAIDRSPCGTGTCAKMAALHAKGQLALNQDFRHEGILGTIFTGRLVRETELGPYKAVVPRLTGQAWITGFAQYVLDPDDPSERRHGGRHLGWRDGLSPPRTRGGWQPSRRSACAIAKVHLRTWRSVIFRCAAAAIRSTP